MKRSLAAIAAIAMIAVACGGAADQAADTTPPATDTPGQTEEEAAEQTSEPPPVKLEGNVIVKGQAEASGGSVDIGTGDFFFDPTFVKADEGATVTVALTNDGSAPHTFTIEDQGIDVVLQPGDTGSAELTVSGTVGFICRFHVSGGMQGAFYTEEGADASGSDSSGEPGSDDYDYGY